jgi:hypothetical protein
MLHTRDRTTLGVGPLLGSGSKVTSNTKRLVWSGLIVVGEGLPNCIFNENLNVRGIDATLLGVENHPPHLLIHVIHDVNLLAALVNIVESVDQISANMPFVPRFDGEGVAEDLVEQVVLSRHLDDGGSILGAITLGIGMVKVGVAV